MRLNTFKIKAIVAFMLVLCLSMASLLPAVSASIMVTHTHICPDEEYKDDCTDVRECCTICLNFYNMKGRAPTLYGSLENTLFATPELSSLYSVTELAFWDVAFSTLFSLKVRLNN